MSELSIFQKNPWKITQHIVQTDFLSSKSGTAEEIFSNTFNYCSKSLMISYQKIVLGFKLRSKIGQRIFLTILAKDKTELTEKGKKQNQENSFRNKIVQIERIINQKGKAAIYQIAILAKITKITNLAKEKANQLRKSKRVLERAA